MGKRECKGMQIRDPDGSNYIIPALELFGFEVDQKSLERKIEKESR